MGALLSPAQVLLAAAALLSAGMVMALVPLLRDFALRNCWVDAPDRVRKLHLRTVPNVGGVAIVAGFIAGSLFLASVRHWLPFEPAFWHLNLWMGVVLVHCAGLYDDVSGLSFKKKFLVQVVAAYLLLYGGYRIEVAHLPFISADPYEQALISIPLTWLWIVGVINAVNLLDGLDGLAAGVVLIAFTSLAAVYVLQGSPGIALLAVPVVGALLGFLMYNSNPASIFMGDSGSLFLGLLLAAFSLQGQVHTDPVLALLVPVVALGLPVLDTAVAIARRLIRRKALCAPDADHIHHRLVRRWSSQRRAVFMLYFMAVTFGAGAVGMVLTAPVWGWALLALILGAVLIGLYLLGYLTAVGFSDDGSRAAVAAAKREVYERPVMRSVQEDEVQVHVGVEERTQPVEA